MCQVARVGCRGEIQRATCRDRVHRLSDRPVLERALSEIRDVIDDDVATVGGRAERHDVGGHRRLAAAEAGGEVERRTRRHVVHDLQHGSAFVARPCLARQDGDGGRQVARGLARRQRIHAVRQHADPDAGAGLASGVGQVGLVRGHALPCHATDIGRGAGGQVFEALEALPVRLQLLWAEFVPVGGGLFAWADRLHIGPTGDVVDGRHRHARRDGAKWRKLGYVSTAVRLDESREVGRDVTSDDDENGLVGRYVLLGKLLHIARQFAHTLSLELALRSGARKLDQRRIHFFLGSGPTGLVTQRRLAEGPRRHHGQAQRETQRPNKRSKTNAFTHESSPPANRSNVAKCFHPSKLKLRTSAHHTPILTTARNMRTLDSSRWARRPTVEMHGRTDCKATHALPATARKSLGLNV